MSKLLLMERFCFSHWCVVLMADTLAAEPVARPLDPLAGVLSYLIPGLGQIVQGRTAKGLMFFVCLNSLFFYGMFLGQMKNVWLPNPKTLPPANVFNLELGGVPKAIYHRTQFLGQFWMGIAVWPAILQYAGSDPNALDNNGEPKGLPVLNTYMSTPSEEMLNRLQRDGNKNWDLGWVYTLIAGVLNILVIYDAFAGPAVRDDEEITPTPPPIPVPVPVPQPVLPHAEAAP